ncbi:MAG: hypothetical protein H6510_02995 [Acidobacteria bacterium]|nr:hypothetical protein [Acidobacteriota bacterium]MCB9396764.1 hypothetical protein [Acidobacteriota bacterium]
MVLFLVFSVLAWQSDLERYTQTLNEIEVYRKAVLTEDNVNGRDFEPMRRQVFQQLKNQILPAWCGTAWGFYGTSHWPQQGEIACGVFVVRTLQHAGFVIPDRMAAQPAENIIKNLVSAGPIQRFSRAPLDRVLEWVAAQGDGLYLVGLDCHVGFLIRFEGKTVFCHANYYPPQKVVMEPADGPSPLRDSQYRVIGKLLDDEMMRHWLEGRTFTQRYDYFRE